MEMIIHFFHHQHPQLRHRVVCPHQIQYYRKQVKLQVHRLEMAKRKEEENANYHWMINRYRLTIIRSIIVKLN